MAQIVRAILFAKALATSIPGFLAKIRDSQDFSDIVFRPSQFRHRAHD
jgi:hypothetical protein